VRMYACMHTDNYAAYPQSKQSKTLIRALLQAYQCRIMTCTNDNK